MARVAFYLALVGLAAAECTDCFFPSPWGIPEQKETVEAYFDLASANKTISNIRLWAVPKLDYSKNEEWPFLLQLANEWHGKFFYSKSESQTILNDVFKTNKIEYNFQVFDAFTVQVYLPSTSVQAVWASRDNPDKQGNKKDYLTWCSDRTPEVKQLIQLPFATRIDPLAISQPNGAIQAYCKADHCQTVAASLSSSSLNITGETLGNVRFPEIQVPCTDCSVKKIVLKEPMWCSDEGESRIGKCVSITDLTVKVGKNRIALYFSGGDRERTTLLFYLANIASLVYISTTPQNVPLLASSTRDVQGGGNSGVCNMIREHNINGQGYTIGLVDMGIDLRSSFFIDPVNPTPCSDGNGVPLAKCNNVKTDEKVYKKAKSFVLDGKTYHYQPKSRKVTSVVVQADADGTRGSDHGTSVAGAINGFSFKGMQFEYCEPSKTKNEGIASSAKIALYDVGAYDETHGWSISTPDEDYSKMFAVAHELGAHEFVVPFGSQSGGRYTSFAQDIDNFMADNHDALVVVATGNGGSISSPAVSKNALAVGAFNQAFTGPASFTSQGPTSAGLIKPDVLAPGSRVELPVDDFDGVAAHCSTRDVTGTSISAGLIGGAATLVREYFEKGYHPSGVLTESDRMVNISAATIKAVLVNSARQQPMIVAENGRNCKTTDQAGHGAVHLEHSLPFEDNHNYEMHMFQAVADGGICDRGVCNGAKVGEENILLEFTIKAKNTDVPISATLAWIDPPAVHGSRHKVVQHITLEIEAPSGGVWEQGSAEECNGVEHAFAPVENTQKVTVQVPEKDGIYTVRVKKKFVFGSQEFSVVTTGGSIEKKDSKSLMCCPKGTIATWAGCFDADYTLLTLVCVGIGLVAIVVVVLIYINAKKKAEEAAEKMEETAECTHVVVNKMDE